MKIQNYVRARNEKRRAEILALEAKARENSEKAEALDVILGTDESIVLGGEQNG